MTDEAPRKKLTITRKRTTAIPVSEAGEDVPAAIQRAKKRVIKLDKPKKKQSQPIPARKKPKKPPSQIRAADLNKALSEYSKAWRGFRPLASDIERQIFQFIGARHLSASKRVVTALLKKQRTAKNYLLNSEMDAPVFNLDDTQSGLVSWERANKAARQLVKVEAQRQADKRAKQRR